MEYEVSSTDLFDTWLAALRDAGSRRRIVARIERIKQGNFGDYKSLGDSLYELRFFFGAGYRIYYTLQGNKVVFLLSGGDKSSQSRDIEKAREILDELR